MVRLSGGLMLSRLPLAVLLALALWLRVTSLGGLPEPNGDEAFYGIQAHRLVSGLPPQFVTPTGNPVNPVLVAIEAPLLLLFGPKYWALRTPTAVAGLLAVALAYAWVRRWCDRPTALIAASVLAVMPMAILLSRTGTEPGLTPVFALLALHQAFLGRRFGLLAAFLACLFMHPTNLFLAPIVASVYLGQALPKVERSRWWRVGAEVAAGSGLVLTVFGLMALKRAGSSVYYNHVLYRPPHWPTFLASIPRYLIGQPQYVGLPITRAWIGRFDWLFWSLLVTLAVVGVPGLVRRRRWDCLALIGSLGFSLAAFHGMAGAAVLSTAFHRYGSFLVVPSAMALAFLAREALYTPGEDAAPARARRLPVTIALVLAAGALVTVKVRHFDACNRSGVESLWTLQTEDTGPVERAYRKVSEEIARGRAEGRTEPRGVIAEDWWVGRPFEYLALGRPDVKVVLYETLRWQVTPEMLKAYLRRRAEAGDFMVVNTFARAGLAADLRGVAAADRLEQWDLRGPWSALMIERLRPSSEPPAPLVAGDRAAKGLRVRAR